MESTETISVGLEMGGITRKRVQMGVGEWGGVIWEAEVE